MKSDSFERIKIVGFGDSTTAGTPGFLSPLESPPEGRGDEKSQYAYWMRKAQPDWEVLNRGINGERSDQIIKRFQRDVAGEAPRFVVILAGVNDIYQGYPVDATKTNLLKMYRMSSDIRATPVGCTVLPYNSMGPSAAEKRRELNRWIADTCSKMSVPFCDTAKVVSDPEDPDRLAGSPDGLHPDVEGYRRLALAISATIEKLIHR